MGDPVAASSRPQSGKVLRKVFVTAAVGGLTYLLSNLTQQSTSDSLTLTAFLGGVALVVQFLSDFENRLARVEFDHDRQSTQMRLMVEEKFSAVSDATELFGRVEGSALRTDVIALVRNANRISPDDPDLVRDLARSQVERTSEFLRELSGGGTVVYKDGEDRDWLLALTRNVKRTLDATSRASRTADGQFVDEGLWLTELGARYIEAQRAAVRRGVAIRRLFLLRSPDLIDDPGLLAILKQQEEAGFRLRTINDSDIHGAGRFISDLILFDGTISYESILPATGPIPMLTNTTLITEPGRVRERADRFNDLWEAGADWPRRTRT